MASRRWSFQVAGLTPRRMFRFKVLTLNLKRLHPDKVGAAET